MSDLPGFHANDGFEAYASLRQNVLVRIHLHLLVEADRRRLGREHDRAGRPIDENNLAADAALSYAIYANAPPFVDTLTRLQA